MKYMGWGPSDLGYPRGATSEHVQAILKIMAEESAEIERMRNGI